ncbi:MAG: hypothetical protein ACI4II_07755 [Acutalibacteraceae bacterium]
MFFNKKADEEKMKVFWNWFEQNEDWIISTSKTDAMAVVNAVDENLSPAFACYRVEIEFQLGYNDGRGEFFFFDLNKSSLRKDAEKLGSLMPASLKDNWTFIIEH